MADPDVKIEPTPLSDPAPPAPPVVDPPVDPTPPADVKPAPTRDWKDDRIDKITAQKKELQAEIERLKSANPNPAPQIDTEQLRAQVREEERQRLAVADFNQKCNEVAQGGRQQYPDFDNKIGEIRRLVDQSDPNSVSAYSTMLTAALDTPDPAKTLYELGGDLTEASRILSLSPVKMALELASRAGGVKAKTISRAPNPIKPIDGRTGTVEIDPADAERADNLSTREWMARREKQVAAQARR